MSLKYSQRVIEKITALQTFLSDKYGVQLYRAISISKRKMEKILSGETKPSMRIIKHIATYFCFTENLLINDSLDLPPLEALKVDEGLISIAKNDLDAQMNRLRFKKYFGRNWRVLGHSTRVRLVISVLFICVPLLFYIGYCAKLIITEKADASLQYYQDSNEALYDIFNEDQVEYHNELESTSKANKPDAYYAEVTVGVQLEKIKNISPSTSSFAASMKVYFKFDKDEFRDMFRHYARNVLADLVIDDYYLSHLEEERPHTIEYNDWIDSHQEYFETWVEANDSKYYPGETPSNVLTDKNTMFLVGNGKFVADTYGALKELEQVQYYDEEGKLRTMCYQKVIFDADFTKVFHSSRYPLDSVSFKMYLMPVMDANYLRYIPDRSTTSTGESVSGMIPFFSITNGYRLIKEKDGLKNFLLRICYYKDVNNDPSIDFEHTMRTELEIGVRANRAGISLFLQAFINLFSVIIWIIIAFYYQTFAGEDSIGMLGTGLFGAISSILVGLSMVSEAGIFSLITMINIFTLAVIMIMTLHVISAKRAVIRKDPVLMAYNGIKLRILFYTLTICTIAMFIILPIMSYMWTL